MSVMCRWFGIVPWFLAQRVQRWKPRVLDCLRGVPNVEGWPTCGTSSENIRWFCSNTSSSRSALSAAVFFLNKLISRSFSSHYRTSICTAGHQLVIPSRGLTTYGRRAFSVAGPMFWNSLPRNLRDPSYTAAVFGRSLKTFLFSEYCTSVHSASEAFATMRYINWCFSYLLTMCTCYRTCTLFASAVIAYPAAYRYVLIGWETKLQCERCRTVTRTVVSLWMWKNAWNK